MIEISVQWRQLRLRHPAIEPHRRGSSNPGMHGIVYCVVVTLMNHEIILSFVSARRHTHRCICVYIFKGATGLCVS